MNFMYQLNNQKIQYKRQHFEPLIVQIHWRVIVLGVQTRVYFRVVEKGVVLPLATEKNG